MTRRLPNIIARRAVCRTVAFFSPGREESPVLASLCHSCLSSSFLPLFVIPVSLCHSRVGGNPGEWATRAAEGTLRPARCCPRGSPINPGPLLGNRRGLSGTPFHPPPCPPPQGGREKRMLPFSSRGRDKRMLPFLKGGGIKRASAFSLKVFLSPLPLRERARVRGRGGELSVLGAFPSQRKRFRRNPYCRLDSAAIFPLVAS